MHTIRIKSYVRYLVSAVENNEEMAIEYNDEVLAEVEVETKNEAEGDPGITEIG